MYVDEDSAIRSPDGTEEEQARNNVKTNECYMTDVANIHTSRYRYYDTWYHEWTIRVSVTIRFLGTDGPIPVGARSKVWVCGRSLAGIAGFECRRGHGCQSCVLSGRGLCDGPIPRLEEAYHVCVCH